MSFALKRSLIIERRMFPSPIIPTLDILKRSQLRLVTCFKINVVDHLTLQCFKKTLGYRIVPAFALSTHTLQDR